VPVPLRFLGEEINVSQRNSIGHPTVCLGAQRFYRPSGKGYSGTSHRFMNRLDVWHRPNAALYSSRDCLRQYHHSTQFTKDIGAEKLN